MERSALSAILLAAAKVPRLRRFAYRFAVRFERGTMCSQTLRDLLRTYENVSVGIFTYGDCLMPGGLPRGTKVGSYSSLAGGLRVYRRNHPLGRVSQHPFFYNRRLGYVAKEQIPEDEENPLTIGHDVWLGGGVTITAGCKSIGNGAVVAAGSVVSKDVPAFTVVGGVPAKCIRERFSRETAEAVQESGWFNHDISVLEGAIDAFCRDADPAVIAEIEKSLPQS